MFYDIIFKNQEAFSIYANATNTVNRIIWKKIHQKAVLDFFSFTVYVKYCVIFNFT